MKLFKPAVVDKTTEEKLLWLSKHLNQTVTQTLDTVINHTYQEMKVFDTYLREGI